LYATQAIKKMKELAEDGNFNAVKYLCDSGGLAVTQKVEVEVEGGINIKISDD